jgi:hypothetical protein
MLAFAKNRMYFLLHGISDFISLAELAMFNTFHKYSQNKFVSMLSLQILQRQEHPLNRFRGETCDLERQN